MFPGLPGCSQELQKNLRYRVRYTRSSFRFSVSFRFSATVGVRTNHSTAAGFFETFFSTTCQKTLGELVLFRFHCGL